MVTVVLIVQRLGVPLAGLVAPAALLSAALGFGLQRFVQDIGAGFFITGERQYGFGDVIRIAVTGVTEPVTGTVEDVTLRVTRLRSVSGEVITTPNGQIVQVTNLSRDWARAVIDVPVPATVDVSHVTDVLRRVGDEAYADDDLRKMMLDPPSVMGVEKIEVEHVLGAHGRPDAARQAVRGRARDPGAGRIGAAPGGHHRRRGTRHRPLDRRRIVIGRPRTSTIVLIVLFLGVLALYLVVRPLPVPAGTPAQDGTSVSTTSPSTSRSPTPAPSRTTPRASPSPTSARPPASSPATSPTPSSQAPSAKSPTSSRSASPRPSGTSQPAGTPSPSSSR